MRNFYRLIFDEIRIKMEIDNSEKLNLENILPLLEKLENNFTLELKKMSIKNSLKEVIKQA